MNTYGKFAQDTWKMLAPRQYELIVNPEEWFTNLGKEAENAVGDLSVKIAGKDLQGESYLEKVGRLNAAKTQAEEIVRVEMLTPQAEELTEDEDQEPSEMSLHLQFVKEMRELQQQATEELDQLDRDSHLNQ
ncbi:TnpV protein [Arthrobacter sp. Sr24]